MGSGGTQFDTQDVLSVDRLNQKMVFVGSSAPAVTYAGMLWEDTSTEPPTIKQRNTANAGWIVLNMSTPSQNIECTQEFLMAATTGIYDPFSLTAISSGTISAITGVANHVGILRMTAASGANSGYYFMTGTTGFLIGGGEIFECVFYCNQTVTNNIYIGFHSSTSSTAPTNGCWINIAAAVLSGKCGNGSTTTTGSTYTITAQIWYRCRIVVNAGATQVDFYLYTCTDGVLVWHDTVTANIPTAAAMGVGVTATNSGTSSLVMIDLDFIGFYMPKALTR